MSNYARQIRHGRLVDETNWTQLEQVFSDTKDEYNNPYNTGLINRIFFGNKNFSFAKTETEEIVSSI